MKKITPGDYITWSGETYQYGGKCGILHILQINPYNHIALTDKQFKNGLNKKELVK